MITREIFLKLQNSIQKQKNKIVFFEKKFQELKSTNQKNDHFGDPPKSLIRISGMVEISAEIFLVSIFPQKL